MKLGTRKVLLLLFWLAVAIVVLLVCARRLGDNGIESNGQIINTADPPPEAKR
jgi:hypothetical protein